MMKKNIIWVNAIIFFIGIGACLAQEQKASLQAEPLILYKGETKIIPVTNPTRVIINNPAIADVASVSKDEILVTAKDVGTTNLMWRDILGREHSFKLDIFLEDTSPIKERADNILKELNAPGVFTRNMDSEGKVLLLGSVKTAQDRERVITALGKLKDKIVDLIQVKEEEALVEIGVQVLELNKDATTTLGFAWPGSLSLSETGSSGITGSKWGTLFKILNVRRDAFSWTLDALVQEGKARILSQPRLACQSGKEAELLVGGEKPIMTTEVAALTVSATAVSSAGSTQVDYKEFGIKLKIKPTVKDDKIKLALNVEVSELGAAEILGSLTNITARAYPLSKRTVSTELVLNDGQIMVIGGLKKQKAEEDIRKTPFIGDVPILGALFRKKTSKTGGGQGERGDTELFITLTPNIIKEEIEEEPKPEAPAIPKEEPQVKPQAEPQVLPQPEVKVEAQAPVQPQAEVAPEEDVKKEEVKPEETAQLRKEEPKPEAKIKKIKAKPAKKIKPKKAKKEKIKKETVIKKTPKPKVKAVTKAEGEVKAEPAIGIGAAGGVFPGGVITKEALKPKAEAEVKTKAAPAKKEKVKKTKRPKKEAKVKVFLKETSMPAKEALKSEKPAPTIAPTAQIVAATPAVAPSKEAAKAEPVAKPETVSKPEPVAEPEPQIPVAAQETISDALSAYLAKIAQLIRDNLVYPWVAKQMNMQGTTLLGIHLENTGQLLGVEIRQPSGCALLDDDAVMTVKKIAPYPPFPPEIKRKELRIDLPIVYKIE